MINESIPYPQALSSSNISLDRLDDILEYSLILGNGDVTGLLYSEAGQLVLRINKNDVWDSRLDTSRDDDLPTLKRLKELAFEEWPNMLWILPRGKKPSGFDSYNDQPYPCPRGCTVVRIGKQDNPNPWQATLHPLQAMAKCNSGTEVRALAGRNVFLIRTPSPVQLEPIVSKTLPDAKQANEDGVHWLKQEIPGDIDWPGMSFAVAMARLDEFTAVAVVTSFEVKDVVKAAISMARETVKESSEKLIEEHEREWQQFWSRSGVQLGDPSLQATWYHNLYFVRCITREGAMPPGLLAGLINDTPAWHGDFHTNYNLQQVFWGCYVANHTELAEPYDRFIAGYLPRAKWIARRVFDMDGAYYPHILYAYEPVDPEHCKSRNGRQYLHHLWAMTIGVNGFSVQPLWWRYKYAPNLDYLRDTVYPALSGTAIFYREFIDQCQRSAHGKVVLAPSMSPEHWGWTPQFDRNRNCTFDLAMARYTLAAAIEAATILNRDEQLVQQWRAAIALLPDYPTTGRAEQKLVVDVQDAPAIEYNIPVPSTPVFPGDMVNWWSPAEQKNLFERTIKSIQWNGNNAMVMLAVARARLSMPGTRDWLVTEIESRLRANGTLMLNRRGDTIFNDFGHYAEQFGVVCAISELLLQSVGDVIRVFPAWPVNRPAKFQHLRTQGGFLVSSEMVDGVVTRIEITSTVGGLLRLQAPWDLLLANGKTISRDQIIQLQTKANEQIVFLPKT